MNEEIIAEVLADSGEVVEKPTTAHETTKPTCPPDPPVAADEYRAHVLPFYIISCPPVPGVTRWSVTPC